MKNKSLNFFTYIGLVLSSLMLVACTNRGVSEVQQWMADVRKNTPVSVPPLSEPKHFEPFTYPSQDQVDPFSTVKLNVLLEKLRAITGKGLQPNLNRRKEPLEEYPLDSIKMVGTIQKAGLIYALLQTKEAPAIFQVKMGNYIGQNFGMITAITESSVELKEVVLDASGEWVERNTKLELQENT